MLSRSSARLVAAKSRNYSTAAAKQASTDAAWTPAAPVFTVSQLKNGVKVATAKNQNAVASVGVFVNAGSRFETPSTLGSTGVMKRLGFKSTQNLSDLRLAREFELLGANYTVGVGKEQIAYASEVTVDKLPEVLQLLREVISPRAPEYEIRFSRPDVQRDTELAETDGKTLLVELVHREAYRNKGLGNAAYTPAYRLNKISDKVVKEFVNSNYSNDRLVIVAAGDLEHQQLVQLAEDLFGTRQASAASSSNAKSEYLGGELKIPGDFSTHLAIAFEGVNQTSKDLFASAVLKALLGGGRRLSKDGPGSGHVSRLYKNVLDAKDWVDEVHAFNFNYSDSGLFGVLGVAKQGNSGQLAQVLTSELKALTSNLSTEEVNRAKEVVKAQTLFTSETRSGLLEFVATQLSTGNSKTVKSPSEFLSGLEGVNAQQVQALAKKIFQSTPTVVAVGDVVDIPTLDQIKQSLH